MQNLMSEDIKFRCKIFMLSSKCVVKFLKNPLLLMSILFGTDRNSILKHKNHSDY